MPTTTSATLSSSPTGVPADPGASPLNGPAVSWGAIFAGATATAVMSLILVVLGTGLGLSSLSPWTNRGASATALGLSAAVWIIVTQVMSSGLGGYIAGRLRLRWNGLHGDEVYFRDTVHGFLAWAVATLVSAVLVASAIGVVLSGGAQAGASLAGGAASLAGASAMSSVASPDKGGEPPRPERGPAGGPLAYWMDSLFRGEPAKPEAAPTSAETREHQRARATAEVLRIFANGLHVGQLPEEDRRQAALLVSQQTQLSPAEAEKRVSEIYGRAQNQLKDAENKAREAADKARKASVHASLWLFISWLMGAFAASWFATLGGRERDL